MKDKDNYYAYLPADHFCLKKNATNYCSPILMHHNGLISYQEKAISFKMQTNAG